MEVSAIITLRKYCRTHENYPTICLQIAKILDQIKVKTDGLQITSLRQVRDNLLMGHLLNLISDEEFVFLYDLNSLKNPDSPFWKYNKFDFDLMADDK